MEDGCGPFPITHIPNGILTDRFDERPKQPRILMTGRLLPRKGFHLVLEALQGVTMDLEVHLAGDGPDRERLETLAAQLDVTVVFHGWLSHDDPLLRELYETSRIFCLPSSRENASVSLLEAMLAGMAVVTTNVTGCPETVGDTGVVVPPDDVPALRAALIPLLESPERCAELGARAQARVRAEFDWEHITGAYLDLFHRLASGESADANPADGPE